jgi:hypothetical protein
MSAPTRPLLDEIYRQKVQQARSMTPEERVIEVGKHTAAVVDLMLAGLREQFLEASETELLAKLRERLDGLRRAKGKL